MADYTLAQLQARCDYGQFVLSVVTPTSLVRGDHDRQNLVTASAGATRVAVSWTGVLQGRSYKGKGTLVADLNLSALAQQIVLNSAYDELNTYAMRANTLGKAPGSDLAG